MKKLLTILAFVLCALGARADLLSGIPTTNAMHQATNYFVMTDGQYEWRISPSNVVSGNLEYQLASATTAGATSFALNKNAAFPQSGAGHIAIGLFTTNCEIRVCNTVSGATVSGFANPLTFPHAAGERVLYFSGAADLTWWNVQHSSSVGDEYAIQNALWECAVNGGVILDGGRQYAYIRHGLVVPQSSQVRRLWINDHANYRQNSNSAALMIAGDGKRITFTADAGTDTITTSATWGPPNAPTNTFVVFWGTNLPPPLSNGIPYFIRDTDTNVTMTVKLYHSDSSALDLTGAGAGNMYVFTKVDAMAKAYWQDVYVNLDTSYTNAAANGIMGAIQQPSWWKDVRVDNAYGTAIRVWGQQLVAFNTEISACGVGWDLRRSAPFGTEGMSFLWSYGYNCETYTNAIILGGVQNSFWGNHFETAAATNSVIVDGTKQSNSSMFDGVSSSENDQQTNFKMGSSDGSVRSTYILRNIWTPSAAQNNGMKILQDDERGKIIWAWEDGNGASCHQYLSEVVAPRVGTSGTFTDELGGINAWGLAGRAFHVGSQYGTIPFGFVQAGTNDSADLWQWRDWAGTAKAGVGPRGRVYARSFTPEYTNAPTASALTVDVAGPSSFVVTNAAANNTTLTIANVTLGGNVTVTQQGSGTATNSNLAWIFPAGVVVKWLGLSTNASLTSNLVNRTSIEFYLSGAVTNALVGWRE